MNPAPSTTNDRMRAVITVHPRRWVITTAAGLWLTAADISCVEVEGMDPAHPARGPGQLVGLGEPLNRSAFPGGYEATPAPAMVTPPVPDATIECGPQCRAYCDGLALKNPVNRGACSSTWGVGMTSAPLVRDEACSRLFVDLTGRFPTLQEREETCKGDDWGKIARGLLAQDSFVLVQQRRFADALLYNNRLVNVERIYDFDELVAKVYRGLVSWDQFAEVASAHPVLMRRYASPEDRVDAVFRLFIGRPPYLEEKADLARLYRPWRNGYFDHPYLGRVPDAYLSYDCVDKNGKKDASLEGPCTSVLFGKNSVVLVPDARVHRTKDPEQVGTMWSGYLRNAEWTALQAPGRILSTRREFWEHAVDLALEQYFGYDLGTRLPEVRTELMRALADAHGDIRVVHDAIVTSSIYLQSSMGGEELSWPWLTGPQKQISGEGWAETLYRFAGASNTTTCDHRISYPEDYLREDASGWSKAMLRDSGWIGEAGLEGADFRAARLIRSLGGCQRNESTGSYTAVSIVNTAVQESAIIELCRQSMKYDATDARRIHLPQDVAGDRPVDAASAEKIFRYQVEHLSGRRVVPEETQGLASIVQACQDDADGCLADRFGVASCYAVLSAAERIFY